MAFSQNAISTLCSVIVAAILKSIAWVCCVFVFPSPGSNPRLRYLIVALSARQCSVIVTFSLGATARLCSVILALYFGAIAMLRSVIVAVFVIARLRSVIVAFSLGAIARLCSVIVALPFSAISRLQSALWLILLVSLLGYGLQLWLFLLVNC